MNNKNRRQKAGNRSVPSAQIVTDIYLHFNCNASIPVIIVSKVGADKYLRTMGYGYVIRNHW